MTLERLIVGGLRGVSHDQTLTFAQPDGRPGSGLTILVGTNNAGKSTVVEALRAVAYQQTVAFSEGKRNRPYGDRVDIRLDLDGGRSRDLKSIRPSSSQTARENVDTLQLAVIPSRRSFQPYFSDTSNNRMARDNYMQGTEPPVQRDPSLSTFYYRLNQLGNDTGGRAAFDRLLSQILGYVPDWSIDQNDMGSNYLKFIWNTAGGGPQSHSSDGLGEGLVSLFVILDALHDADPGTAIVIDEPELSLHPQFQRRLRTLLSTMASDRQIIYATHSPYFIDWNDVTNGAAISRVHKSDQGTTISTPSRTALNRFIAAGHGNLNNPHLLGLDATEVFFLEGGIVLAEGQEDVVLLPGVVTQVGVATTPWSYFGWGVGGAGNMDAVADLLQELGYDRVVGILDNDQLPTRDALRVKYPEYRFECIPASDIRPKKATPASEGKPGKEGLTDGTGALRTEHVADVRTLVQTVENYFKTKSEIV